MMNNPSRDAEKGKATTTQQKGKATQHNSLEIIWLPLVGLEPTTISFPGKMLLPTKLPRQLSWLGRILHTNHKASQPDEQVNSNLVFRRPR